MKSRSASPQLDVLQALRGIAAFFILLAHTILKWNGLQNTIPLVGRWFTWGWIGVDVFFCLSGFVIMWAYAGDIGHPQRSGAFAWKRLIRVCPPYFIFLLIVAAASYIAARNGYQTLNRLPSAIMRPGALIQSISLLPPYSQLVVGVAWTMVHETLFYILFCGAIVLGRRAAQIGACLWLLAILFYPHPDGGTVSLNCDILFSPYNLNFLGGIAAAWLARRVRSVALPSIGAMVSLSVVIAGCVLGWWHFFRGNQGPSFLREKIVLAACFSVLLCSLVRLELAGWIRVPWMLVFLGEASYSIYLVHDNIIRWVNALTVHFVSSLPEHFWKSQAFLAANASFALTCGILYYLGVERPLLRRGRQWLKQTGR